MDEGRYTFREHLVELRARLLRAVVMVLLCALASYAFADTLYTWLSTPMREAIPEGAQLIVTSVIEAFLVKLKLSLTAGIFLASPWVLYQLWAFIAPGLYKQEQTYAGAFVVSGSFFFVAGAAFCFYVVFPVGLPFLIAMNPPDVIGMYKVGEYYSFVIRMLLAAGFGFELPVAVVMLTLLGVVDPKQLLRFRKYALLLSFVASAVLTPPDPASQVLIAVPLYLLFEGGLLVARVIGDRRAPREADAEAPADSGGSDATDQDPVSPVG